ncbi:MAG TPA: insulinase family protein [Vicinamibacterales bacterium]|nr:insulinase family protein [Vicinamibacterales bacterium]
MRNLRFRAVVLAAGLLFFVTPSSPGRAQAPAPAPKPDFSPADPLPFDADVVRGTLANGLTYYIRKNDRPDDRVMLQLAVKAGSVDETDQQQGLAHFLEHMAFNGSRHFKPGELIKTLESTGARMGPHVNAYTSFDETVYMFQVPTDKEGTVEKGLQGLADVGGSLTLDPKEIDKERGVVIEEWRGGLGAAARLRDQQIPVLYHGSKYAERLPIGKPEVLKSFTPATLRAFYTQWYRPDRMALVVVGDIDPAKIEAQVKTMFGGMAKSSAPAPARAYDVPLHTELLVEVATDPEATQSSVSVLRKRNKLGDDTVADYRRNLAEQMVHQMLNERFDELSRKRDAQFLGAGAYETSLSPTVAAFALGAGVEEGKIPQGLAALEIETNRVQQHGFGASELERAKKWWLASYERAYNEREKSESGSYAQEYVSHFLQGEPAPGIEYEYRLAQGLIPAMTATEVGEIARSLFADTARVIIATSPRKDGLAVPTEAQLRDTVVKADAVAVMAWNDAGSGRALMDAPPDPGAIKDKRDIPELGVTVVRFANGVEAWLKPTDFKNDEVLYSLAAPGGASVAPPDNFVEALLAPALVQVSGVGGHRAVDLQKLLAGKLAHANPSISLSTHAITGSARPGDLETGLQLLHLNFTSPGNDDEAFENIKKQLDAMYANREQNPNLLYSEKVGQVNSGNHYTAAPVTRERLAKLDRAAMAGFYRERFSNAADFTFIMVGAFNLGDAIPLVARYVGSLPSKGQPAGKVRDVGLKFPASIERATVNKGREPKITTRISFFADPPQDPSEITRVSTAADVLEIALRDILREELGETYSVGVGLQQETFQRGGGHIAVTFTAAPENLRKMTDRVMQEVQRMQKEGPTEDLVNRARETAMREHETGMKENGYWLSRLQAAKLLDRDPIAHVLERDDRIRSVTAANVKEMFVKYFPMDRYTIVTLAPE